MNRRPPGYKTQKFREQGNEERCQLRQLIREQCPRGEFGYLVPDIDIIIYDKTDPKTIHITIIEKKIGNAPLYTWQEKILNIIAKIFEIGVISVQDERKRIQFHGWHIVRVPDNEDWKKWSYVEYDGVKISPEKFVEILNHNPFEPVEGGWKIE